MPVESFLFFQDFKAAFKNYRDNLFCSFSCPENKTTQTSAAVVEKKKFLLSVSVHAELQPQCC